MKNAKFLIAVFCLMVFVMADAASAAIPAFPEAQGGGATATGGRGGAIIEVTNLNPTGPGSFYNALKASGARTIVFKVSGIIDWSSIPDNGCGNKCVAVTNGDLTVAGQTSPGFGILIKNSNGIVLAASNNIIRYITIRPGYKGGTRSIEIDHDSRQMIDHVSVSWVNDDAFGIWNYGTGSKMSNDITLQWSIISEGFYPAGDPWGGHALGTNIGAETEATAGFTGIDIHHNLYAHFNERMPQVKNGEASVTNNIIYNGHTLLSIFFGAGKFDFIGNIYKGVPELGQKEISGQEKLGRPDMGLSGTPSVYVSGNKGYTQPDPNGEQWIMVAKNPYTPGTPAPPEWRRYTPNPPAPYPVKVDSASNLESILLPTVGNSRYLDANGKWVNRNDPVDARIIQDYIKGTGDVPPNQDAVGGYPTYYYVAPYTDSDHDGMPDIWEISHGLNPNNAADANLDTDNDGYTNVEEFLNGNTATAPNPTPTCTDSIQNQGETGVDCGGPCPACSSSPTSLTLKPGWNQISSPVAAGIDLATIEASCTILQYKSQKLWAWNAQTQTWINPARVEPFRGYWIYSAYQCAVPLSGTPATFTSLPLSVGWNKISASGTFSAIKGTCAGHITGNWVWHWDKATEKWVHPTAMQLDKGYWIKVDQNCVLGG